MSAPHDTRNKSTTKKIICDGRRTWTEDCPIRDKCIKYKAYTYSSTAPSLLFTSYIKSLYTYNPSVHIQCRVSLQRLVCCFLIVFNTLRIADFDIIVSPL